MELGKKIKNVLNGNKNILQEEFDYLTILPETQIEQGLLNNSVDRLATSGLMCNIADWKTITKDTVLSVEVPLGFKRNLEEAFEVFVSIDKSFLYTRDMMQMKTADIYIDLEDGTTQTMRCLAEVIQKLLEGELIINTIVKGFKAIDFLNANVSSTQLHLEEKTAFTHTQGVLFNEQIGYMCKECNRDEQEVIVTVNIGRPFIILADGTRIEDGQVEGLSTKDISARQQITFDDVLNGMETIMISIPCQITAQVEIEIIS